MPLAFHLLAKVRLGRRLRGLEWLVPLLVFLCLRAVHQLGWLLACLQSWWLLVLELHWSQVLWLKAW